MVSVCISGCSIFQAGSQDIRNTQIALGVEQTMIAQQQDQIQTPTTIPSEPQVFSTATTDLTAPTSLPTASAAYTTTLTPTSAPPDVTTSDLDTWMKSSANILLYEEIKSNPIALRYIKETLDYMGLKYVDTGSGIGDLRDELQTEGPEGTGWDLIIISAEGDDRISGEFFNLIEDKLDQKASVILEISYLDDIYKGKISPLLARCGIKYQSNWSDVPPSGMIMYQLDLTHPIMKDPNTGLTFTNVTEFYDDFPSFFFFDEIDIGDRVELSGGSDAKILVGTNQSTADSNGTITVCIDDRLILQTFSTHQLTFDEMRPLWENYIYNALGTRYQSLP